MISSSASHSSNSFLTLNALQNPFIQPDSAQRAALFPNENEWAPLSTTKDLMGNPIQPSKTHHVSKQVLSRKRRSANSPLNAEHHLSRSNRSTNSPQCYKAFAAATGTGIIENTGLHTYTPGWQFKPLSQSLSSGKTLVTWILKDQKSEPTFHVYGQLFTPKGKAIIEENFTVGRSRRNRIIFDLSPWGGVKGFEFVRELPYRDGTVNPFSLQSLAEDKVALFHQKNIGGPSPIEVTIFDTKSNRVDRKFSVGSNVVNESYGTCALKNGNLLSVYQDTSGSVHAQIYSSQGEKLLAEEISLESPQDQKHLGFFITPLLNGNFVIAYQDASGVKGKIFSPNLQALDQSFIACSACDQNLSQVFLEALPNGDFLISCLKKNNGSFGIHGEILSAQGEVTGRGFDIDTGSFTSISYSLTTTPISGDIIVAWHKIDGSTQPIKVQTFSSTAEAKGREVSLGQGSGSSLRNPTVSYIGNGAVLVAWQQGKMDITGRNEADVWAARIVLTDLLTKLPEENVRQRAQIAQKCISKRTSLNHTLEEERQTSQQLSQNHLDHTRLLNDTLEEEKKKYRNQAFAEKVWRIVCYCTSPVILVSMITNFVLSVLLRKKKYCKQIGYSDVDKQDSPDDGKIITRA